MFHRPGGYSFSAVFGDKHYYAFQTKDALDDFVARTGAEVCTPPKL